MRFLPSADPDSESGVVEKYAGVHFVCGVPRDHASSVVARGAPFGGGKIQINGWVMELGCTRLLITAVYTFTPAKTCNASAIRLWTR